MYKGIYRNITFPAPEQFEHLSVLGGDRGSSPPFTIATGSIRTRAPVLEQRAQARYPASVNKYSQFQYCSTLNVNLCNCCTFLQPQQNQEYEIYDSRDIVISFRYYILKLLS